jgi:precorrin-2 dehydrogenase/sirohydrochlorin ferrochelatase
MYAINLDITDKLCVVVGGGEVAARKIRTLLLAKARVLVVSPIICQQIKIYQQENKLKWLAIKYNSDVLKNATLVFAATDNQQVQQTISNDAKKAGCLLNNAADPDCSSFHLPAVVQRGDLSITVSTNGASPALAAQIKDELKQQYGAEYGQYVKLLGLIRPFVIKNDNLHQAHKKLFKKLVQTNILALIKKNDWQQVQEILSQLLPANVDVGFIIAQVAHF